MTDALDDQQITTALDALPGWSRAGEGITRTFEFDGYRDAVAFAVRVALEAEVANHHPDLLLTWGRVEVSFTSHDVGGITQRDVDLATAVSALV